MVSGTKKRINENVKLFLEIKKEKFYMKNIRLMARLDVKGPNLVKGVQFEGLRKLGKPNDFAKHYYEAGIDELLYIDIVASLYERNNLTEIVRECTKDIFVPITVGGGIRNLNDVKRVLECGADKIAINTAAIKNPEIISQVADKYGSQCMVLSIHAKQKAKNQWEVYYDNGREHTGIDVVEWAMKGQGFGAGEILLTSVDKEGTQEGFDIELIKAVSEAVSIPVIAGGGFGAKEDFVEAVKEGGVDAVAVASALHYRKETISGIKLYAKEQGINVRLVQ